MSNRNEFISIVNTLISLSKSITDEQYKALLQQAVQEYDLTVDEASDILRAYGLVIGKRVNYFEVLGLSIEELTNQEEIEIASLIENEHKRRYTESLQAGGLPRSDGRTQEQWRTLLNEAFETLIDPHKRTEYITTIHSEESQPGAPLPQEELSSTDEATFGISITKDMALIPVGEFQMGNDNERANDSEIPVHTVYVDTFYMDKYPVTNIQYKQFIDANPLWSKPTGRYGLTGLKTLSVFRKFHDGDYLKDWNGSNFPVGKDSHPVTHISWYAAMAYAQWIGKRLPTEAEWEKAARGGLTEQKYPWGNVLDLNKSYYDKNFNQTISVGEYPPNDYGLFDMVGNVWEWCLDAYNSKYYISSPKRNPIAGMNSKDDLDILISNFRKVETDRVLRGGTQFTTSEPIHIGTRWAASPETTGILASNPTKVATLLSPGLIANIGFRCVRDVNM
ncbi:formylglycine-generating enzyme family protein [Candidatus Poribacteria bacterium]|nr:formylglycine-generating enzyme family protein [Candidatus Poribacteria bacterium]